MRFDVCAFKKIPAPVRYGFLFALFFGLLASRRWMQLTAPQVWNEDGLVIIPSFLQHGIASFLLPVNGYLMTVPKLISFASLLISVHHYPLVSTVITFVFTALIGLAVALSPTKLRGRLWCAIALFCVPANPEIFGLPLYTSWWAAVLLFLVCLWDERDQSIGLRMVYLLAGGLSSPVIPVTLPVLYARAWRYRAQRGEVAVAAAATVIAAAQLWCILTNAPAEKPPLALLATDAFPLFFGNLLVGNYAKEALPLWFAGGAVAAIIGALFIKAPRDITLSVLLALALGLIAVTAQRVDFRVIHISEPAPRYFFYPFVLLSWLLLQGFYLLRSKKARALLSLVVLMALVNGLPTWSRPHGELPWKEHLDQCLKHPRYGMPIMYDGSTDTLWYLRLERGDWQKLLNKDVF